MPRTFIKPIIKVWCLPKQSEEALQALFKRIVLAAKKVAEVGIEDEKSLIVLFPIDMMQYGLGTEIVIEITQMPVILNNRQCAFAMEIQNAVGSSFPKADIQTSATNVDGANVSLFFGPSYR